MVSVPGLWQEYSLRQKWRAVSTRRWAPTDAELSVAAKPAFLQELYGGTDDAGEAILDLMIDHWQSRPSFELLTQHDRRRADALRAYTMLTRQRYRGVVSSPPLNLSLLRRAPLMCTLLNPMILKVPVTSLQYFLDIHVHFAFNEIRRAQHPHADEIIGLIYETLFLQQKTAITLKSLLGHMVAMGAKVADSLLTHSEVDAIIAADLLFVYVKATVEKVVALVGHVLELSLEDKKAHKKRLDALRSAMPESAVRTPYGALLLEFVSSEALERLNASRTGLLHKMGISDLQPHNYVGSRAEDTALRKLFAFLYEQHSKNTLILLAAFALLTDDLMRRCPPSDIPEYVVRFHPSIHEAISHFAAGFEPKSNSQDRAG
jgi:hypothetical protein